MHNNQILNQLFTVPQSYRNQFLANNRTLLNELSFNREYNARAKKLGDAKRLETLRKSCSTAYRAKKQLVESGKGNHSFVHPSTDVI